MPEQPTSWQPNEGGLEGTWPCRQTTLSLRSAAAGQRSYRGCGRGRGLRSFGIAGGRESGFIYSHGRVLKKVASEELIDELFQEIDHWIAEGMHRPKRLKMAKPAALAMAEASMIPLD